MSVTFLGFPNYSSLDYVTASTSGAGSLEPADMVASWLKTEEPSELARLTTLDPQHTQWAFATGGIPIDLLGFHVINHNLTHQSQIRVTGNLTGATINSPSVLPPNAILASSNQTGAVTSVDEDIYTPDGNTIGPTTTTAPWSARFGFPTPGSQPLGGTDTLCWVFRARRIAGSTLTHYPVVWCDLYEDGVLVRALGWRAVTETTSGGQVFIFPFNLNELADSTCADIEVKLTFNPGAGTGGQYAVLESLSLYYELSSSTKDTGWITLTEDDRQGPSRRRRDWYKAVSGWDNLLGYTIMFRGDLAVHDPLLATVDDMDKVPSGAIRRLPDSFVQAGVVNAGAGLDLSQGIDNQQRLAVGMEMQEVRTDALPQGQTYGYDAWRRFKTPPLTLYLTEAEFRTLRDQTSVRRGRSGAFSFALDSDSTETGDTLWCTLEELGTPEWFGTTGGVDYYTVQISLSEKL